MTRLELLRLVIGKARSNGFAFRRWYTARLNEPWVNAEASLQRLEEHRRYYSLLFSHEFARSFWKPGSEITFQVEAQTFQRRMRDGTIATVKRKPFTRRSARRDAWRFHLREMAAAEEPLRYIRRYLHVQEDGSEPKETASPAGAGAPPSTCTEAPRAKPRLQPRPLPSGPPAFLLRPYGARGPESGSA